MKVGVGFGVPRSAPTQPLAGTRRTPRAPPSPRCQPRPERARARANGAGHCVRPGRSEDPPSPPVLRSREWKLRGTPFSPPHSPLPDGPRTKNFWSVGPARPQKSLHLPGPPRPPQQLRAGRAPKPSAGPGANEASPAPDPARAPHGRTPGPAARPRAGTARRLPGAVVPEPAGPGPRGVQTYGEGPARAARTPRSSPGARPALPRTARPRARSLAPRAHLDAHRTWAGGCLPIAPTFTCEPGADPSGAGVFLQLGLPLWVASWPRGPWPGVSWTLASWRMDAWMGRWDDSWAGWS